ncbi:MAG TPA: metallophosphoesterase [Candidatus Solibacter sp.]|jgi:predicted phosphodiesterase|nr:metallophosphoesterase [Candidatus Solibacter sp.]
MRVFAISDLHVEHAENDRWVSGISTWDYRNDVLICAGDVAQSEKLLGSAFERLRHRFQAIVYVPGNHELWVVPRPGNGSPEKNSIDKFHQVQALARECGVGTEPLDLETVSLVPLLAWYDHSYGEPGEDLLQRWSDYHLCSWPELFDQPRITEYFLALNQSFLKARRQSVISFSHFVPREDFLPTAGSSRGFLRPVLGTSLIDAQVRQLGSFLHIYGHYHVNSRTERDNITYINNAYGYPREAHIAAKKLVCVFNTEKANGGRPQVCYEYCG